MSDLEREHEELCLRAMDDLKMEPEDFGALLHSYTQRVMPFDPQSIKDDKSRSIVQFRKLDYRFRLYELERKLTGN